MATAEHVVGRPAITAAGGGGDAGALVRVLLAWVQRTLSVFGPGAFVLGGTFIMVHVRPGITLLDAVMFGQLQIHRLWPVSVLASAALFLGCPQLMHRGSGRVPY